MNVFRYLKFVWLLFLGICFPFLSTAQNTEKIDQLVLTALKKEPSNLFIHFDKTIYVPNESIYFSAYFITNNIHFEIGPILNLALVKRDNQKVYSFKKYIVNDLNANGSLIVPDSIPEGNYTLLAFTNTHIEGQLNHTFKQHIFIKDPAKPNTVSNTKSVAEQKLTSEKDNKIALKFYPEGGNLVDGISSVIGFEAKDHAGTPQKVKASLYKNNILIDTIETSAFGLGKFKVETKLGDQLHAVLLTASADAKFILPEIRARGIGLQLRDAAAKDTLDFTILTPKVEKISIVLHNAQNAFYINYNTTINKHRDFKIPLSSLPKGLSAITIFNEDAEPIAERMFYAHYAEKSTGILSTDKEQYEMKSPVKLNIGFNSEMDTTALVSLAVVQLNRIDRRNFQQIDNYTFLSQDIEYLPAAFLIATEQDKKNHINDLLLVRGWRSYAPNKPIELIDPPSGTVTRFKRSLKKPINLTLMGNNNMQIILTEADGKFDLHWEEMAVGYNKKLKLFAPGEDANYTSIKIEDHALPFLSKYVKDGVSSPTNKTLVEEVPKLENFFFQNQINIQEVVISKSRSSDYIGRFLPAGGTNACGDYVCEYKILNCPNHRMSPYNTAPVVGSLYSTTIGRVPYSGCTDYQSKVSLTEFEGVNYVKEIYSYSRQDVDLGSPLYHSTLYWQPDLKLKPGKSQEINFFTGDIHGNFAVILQGISDNSVIYSEKFFSIKK